MRDVTEPASPRGQRVLLILRTAHEGGDLAELHRNRRDLWPAGPHGGAGDRKWTRDLRDALSGRIYGDQDTVFERRVRLLDWLEEHGPASVSETAAEFGVGEQTAWLDLHRAGAVVVAYQPIGSGGRRSLWAVENLAPSRARRAA